MGRALEVEERNSEGQGAHGIHELANARRTCSDCRSLAGLKSA